MGRNTAVLLLNDSIMQSRDNPTAFVESLLDAFSQFRNKPVHFRVGALGHGGTVFHEAHADTTGVYAIGGNTTTKLLTTTDARHDKIALLEQLAEELGFKLVPA